MFSYLIPNSIPLFVLNNIRFKSRMSSMILMVLLVILFIGTTSAVKLSPCQVKNIIVQPRFGISATTKGLIDIIQIPPMITQNVLIGICSGIKRNTPDLNTHYICKQRYTLIEVYTKLMIPGEPTNSTDSESDPSLSGIFKDFIIVDAGCDVSLNFLPLVLRGGMKGRKMSSASLDEPNFNMGHSPEVVGISSLVDQKLFLQSVANTAVNNLDIPQFESPLEYKSSNLTPRSTIQDDFFKSGFHLNSTSPKLPLPSSNYTSEENPSFPKNSSSIEPDTKRTTETRLSEKVGESNVTSSFHLQLDEIRMQEYFSQHNFEVPLSLDDIGLPILILESSLDPVFTIISSSGMK